MTRPNPITERLQRLYQQWEAFVGDSAPLLRWRFRADELRMLEVFLAIEDDEAGELPALFLVLDAAFDPRLYGHELCRLVDVQLASMTENLEALGLPAWRKRPPSASGVSDIGSLMATCEAAAHHLGDHLEQLVLVLWPRRVEDPGAFVEWLTRAARVVPERVRLVVVDQVEQPALEALSELGPARVCSVRADLDMPGALAETVAAAPHGEDPGGRFRAAYVAMSTALAGGDLDNARRRAGDAESIARENALPHLEAAAPFGLATGLLAAGQHAPALEQYRRAEELAQAALDDRSGNHEWAPSLHVQAGLGVAATLVAAGALELAAKCYLSTAARAAGIEDRRTQFEALRMAADCFERAGLVDEAYAQALAALKFAGTLGDKLRDHSTLPWLGEQLMRLTARGTPRHDDHPAINRQLDLLLEGDWRLALAH